MVELRDLSAHEIDRTLFRSFIRRQTVTKCWRRDKGEWVIREDPFVDDWTEADYEELIAGLRETARSGGLVHAAFQDGRLKGFVSVERGLFGPSRQYLDLTHIYVSADLRRQGVGRTLFTAAKAWAKSRGAEKLYISAHSAVESQAFYHSMGCVEAQAYCLKHVEKEPWDCQMECAL